MSRPRSCKVVYSASSWAYVGVKPHSVAVFTTSSTRASVVGERHVVALLVLHGEVVDAGSHGSFFR